MPLKLRICCREQVGVTNRVHITSSGGIWSRL